MLNCTQYESKELDKIQNEAARIVTGATKLASIDSLHTEICWETLGSRRKTHKLTMFYKMKNRLCPDYLNYLVPASVGSASTYPLRNSSDLQTLHTNSRLYYTSFLPSAVRIWNELPEQTRNSPSLNIFKNSLEFNLITPPRYYNTGKRLGQIYHARLKTACSPLRQHLHSKHIVDYPYCTCEDTHHFLFVCHQYTDLIRDLLNSVSDICQPNLNLLLCGDITLTFVQNKQLF